MKKIFVCMVLAAMCSAEAISQEVAADSVLSLRSYGYRVEWAKSYSTILPFEKAKQLLIEQMEERDGILFLQSSNERIVRAKFDKVKLSQKDIFIDEARTFLTANVRIEVLDGQYKVKVTNGIIISETGILAGIQQFTFEKMFLRSNAGSFYRMGMAKSAKFYEDFFDGIFTIKSQ